jgi:hypothetical protein
MTLEKTPHGENQLEIDVYIWRSQSKIYNKQIHKEPNTIQACPQACNGVP